MIPTFHQCSSKVIATVDDYEADRATDQKRLEQRLHDLEESFNELNGNTMFLLIIQIMKSFFGVRPML